MAKEFEQRRKCIKLNIRPINYYSLKSVLKQEIRIINTFTEDKRKRRL